MPQRFIYALELLVLAGFVWAAIYRLARQSAALKKCQKTGCLSGGCLLPLLFLIFSIAAGDPGGPLFWPLISILGAMFGIVLGTLYSVCRGNK
jgi:uncharacterized membrane protein YdjX (TVP38/TMEM64 family)